MHACLESATELGASPLWLFLFWDFPLAYASPVVVPASPVVLQDIKAAGFLLEF